MIRTRLRLSAWRAFGFLFRLSDAYLRLSLLVALVLWSGYHFYQQPDVPTLNSSSYDNLVRHRWFAPSPDPDIVIVDIDEASLAQMGQDFGRWPWPRDTLAAVLGWLEYQGARAVVFDILFSDPDQLNKAADASFAEAVRQSRTSYFPVLRLNPENDRISEVRASQLGGFATPSGSGIGDITLAAVVPLFDSAMDSGRLGYHNVYPDHDGVLRHYRYWEEKAGWRIWSLPARMAQDFAWGLPAQREPLLNWHHTATAHVAIPFFDVWTQSQSRAGQQPDPRFRGKIVLIGATATSLFDVKTTPVATIHPGVEVLATAIDNLKNHRYLQQLPRWLELLLGLFALLLMFAAGRVFPDKKIKWAIIVAPTLLMGISFASLHWSGWYLDLAIPASQAFVFFTLLGTFRAKKQNYWSRPGVLGESGQTQAWAISSTTMNQHDLMDFLAVDCARVSRLCLQSLVWQRRSDRTDLALWIIRVAGETPARLAMDAERIQACIERIRAMGRLQNVVSGKAEPFQRLPHSIGLAGKLKAWLGLDSESYPFLASDQELAAALFAMDGPEAFGGD